MEGRQIAALSMVMEIPGRICLDASILYPSLLSLRNQYKDRLAAIRCTPQKPKPQRLFLQFGILEIVYDMFFSIYPHVNGKKSNFSVPVCTKPNDSYHFLNALFSSTIPILIFLQFNSFALENACPKSSAPMPLCLYAGSTHKLLSSHSLLSCKNKE